ncbi:MAG TPA: tripartite tricarboxylate transporter substrate binding protein [Burkholderiales bacterium]|nr:tripartite tricarboxylate transporter substrate binding protein [Burkholderiales bacterium]
MRKDSSLKTLLTVLAAAAGMLGCAAAQAQAYPSKTITIILTSSFGGTHDVLVRGIAENITAKTGATVIVEPKPGGGGALGLATLVKAEPDGHTIAMTFGGAVLVNPHTTPALGWTVANFTPITRLVSAPNIFVASPNFPAKNFADMLKLAKEKPGTVSVAFGGAGNKVGLAILESRTGAKFLWVPVNTTPFVQALGDHVNLAVETPSTVENLLREGKLRNMGVGSLKPYKYMPEADLIAKTVPGFEMGFWWGMLAPAGLPKDRLQWLHREIVAGLNETRLKARLFAYGYDVIDETPEQFAAYLKENDALYAKIIRDYKIQ